MWVIARLKRRGRFFGILTGPGADKSCPRRVIPIRRYGLLLELFVLELLDPELLLLGVVAAP
jgi:hypothetical protein